MKEIKEVIEEVIEEVITDAVTKAKLGVTAYEVIRMRYRPWKYKIKEIGWKESSIAAGYYMERKEKVIATNLTKLEAEGWVKLLRSYDNG